MQACVDWVLITFGTQVINKKRPVRPVFPDYLSVSYDYASTSCKFSRDRQDPLSSFVVLKKSAKLKSLFATVILLFNFNVESTPQTINLHKHVRINLISRLMERITVASRVLNYFCTML